MMIDGWIVQGINGEEGIGHLVLQKIVVGLRVLLQPTFRIVLHQLYGYQKTFNGSWCLAGSGSNPHGIEPVNIDVVGNSDYMVAAWIECQRHQCVLK